jgi:hypothetical protein
MGCVAHERSSTPPAPVIRVFGEVVSGVGVRKKCGVCWMFLTTADPRFVKPVVVQNSKWMFSSVRNTGN